MADALELQPERLKLQRVGRGGSEVAVFGHLRKHHISAFLHKLRTAKRVVKRAVFEHAHQHRRLLHIELRRRLVEVHIGRAFNPDRLVDKVVAVEVKGDDFLLGVVAFQAGGDDPLLGLLEYCAFKKAGRLYWSVNSSFATVG